MTLTTILAVVVPVAAAIPTVAAAWLKLREVLSPILARRPLRVAVLAGDLDSEMADAQKFVAGLRKAGYREVVLTQSPQAVADRRVVILWKPAPGQAVATLGEVQRTAPEAIVPILTLARLDGIQYGDKVLLSNHPLRLMGDLAAIAETTAQ